MKKFLILASLSSLLFSQDLFVNDIKADLIDPKTKAVVGEIYEGSPVKLIKKDCEFSLVKISGEVANTDNKIVAYKKDPLVVFYKLNKTATNEAEFLISSKKLGENEIEAWEEVEMFYYDSCSSCHAAHKPKEHLMSEWEAYIGAMQTFAKISDDEKDRILRFMQAFAKDGYVKE
ncbi:hypothetical protein CR66_05555 [Campylobacter mucosalis]|uniref:c-type cytochrome n=1 Tax=Campylobacter mucosalis TaxID=202 RepID=UPI0004D8F0D4|nr:cytochrome c [Campylobacter mucosalis]KEA45866.1 hypothetical protein CR66_05555 [Campylobacter mucosalis]QKF62400.1 molybdopterin-containing oxidoreductase I, DMSO/TMAO/BSO reductase family, monoheme c-type cytochrome [Campylobacter mucosalis]